MNLTSRLFPFLLLLFFAAAVSAQPAFQVMRGDSGYIPQSIEFTGKFGGYTNTATVKNGTAYVPQSDYVSTINVNNGFTKLSRTKVEGEPHSIDCDSGRVVVSYERWEDAKNTVTTIDVSNPNNLPAGMSYQLPELTTANGILKVDYENGYLYVAEYDTDGKARAIHIYNWSGGPNGSMAVATYVMTTYDFVVQGDYIYITGNKGGSDGVQIVDVSNKVNPNDSGFVAIEDARSIAANGNSVYVGSTNNKGLNTVDVSNKTQPMWASSFKYGEESFSKVVVKGNIVYAQNGNKIIAVDVSDPMNPVLLGEKTFDEYEYDFEINTADSGGVFFTHGGMFGEVDVSNPANMSEKQRLEEPSAYSDIAVGDSGFVCYDYNQNVFAYDVSDPGNPVFQSKGKETSMRKVFTHKGKTYIANGYGEVKVYNNSNMQNLNGTYTAQGEVKAIAFTDSGGFMVGDGGFESADISGPTAPIMLDQASLNGTGKAIHINGNYAYVGTSQGFTIVDISNPGNLYAVNATSVNGEVVGMYSNGSYLIIAANYNNSAYLYAYSVQNPESPQLLKQQQIASSSPWEMAGKDELIAVSVPDTKQVLFYVFFDATNTFVPAGTYESDNQIFGIELFGWNNPQQTLSAAYAARETSKTYYLYASQESKGLKKFQIIIRGGGGSNGDEYTLTVSISPTEAAASGASVTVTPSQAAYEEGDYVTLEAFGGDNGWTFKEYTGDVTEKLSVAGLSMTGDKKAKEVTAHYVQPMLTSSVGSLPRAVFCPDDADGEKLKVMEFTLTANDVDDWLVQALTITNVGDSHMISKVHLQHPGGELVMNVDPTITEYPFGFAESVTVPQSSSVTFSVYYTIDLPLGDKRCAMTRSAEMKAEVKTNSDVAAIPSIYAEGFKAIGAPKTSLPRYIACYENGAGYGFATLQQAIDSDSTNQADEIWVCNGEYAEEVNINKQLEIKAREKQQAVYDVENQSATRYWNIAADNILIDGFYFGAIGTVDNSTLGNSMSHYNMVTVQNCMFENISEPVLYYGAAQSANVINLKNNVFKDSYADPVRLQSVNNSMIEGNRIDNAKTAIKLTGTNDNITFLSNQISNAETGIEFAESNTNITAEDNTFTDISVLGIDVNTKSFTFEGGTFTSMPLALNIDNGSSGVVVENTTFDKCGRVINAVECDTLTVFNVDITGNELEDSVVVLREKVTHAHFNDVRSSFNKGIFSIKGQSTESTFDGLQFYKLLVLYSERQTVKNSNFNMMYLKFAHNSLFDADTISESDYTGFQLAYSRANTIQRCVISNHKQNGLRVGDGWGEHCEGNKILKNYIHSNDMNGIILSESSDNIFKGNAIFNNGENGIQFGEAYSPGVINNYVRSNYIHDNGEHGVEIAAGAQSSIDRNIIRNNGLNGIQLYAGKSANVTNNTISGHNHTIGDAGILLFGDRNSLVQGNVIEDNCTGIRIIGDSEATILNNKINNNLCLFTGINISNSNATVGGNTINNNRGDGLRLDEKSTAEVMNNNFLDNEGFALNNANVSYNVNADGNFWGGEPTSTLFSGNVEVGSWLEDPVRLLLTPDVDTLYAVPGITDTLLVDVQNFVDPADNVTLTVVDDNGWLTGQTEFDVDVQDTLSATIAIEYTPGPEEQIFGDRIIVYAESQTYGSLAADTVYMLNYEPIFTDITITPNNISIAQGSTRQLTANGLDQYGLAMQFASGDFVWYTDNGTIDTAGFFTAPGYDTVVVIGAEHVDYIGDDTPFGVAHISITHEANAIAKINVIPDSVYITTNTGAQFSVVAYDANDFDVQFTPVWSATGGTIDDEGLYTAGDAAGEYEVTATNQSGEVIGTAYVLVKNPVVGVEDEPLPTEFAMDQNYPNPFNPSTTLQYALPFESQVKLEIYNILGQRVAVLVNGVQSAGYKQYLWNAGRLASGVYIARLIAKPNNGSNMFVDIKKMILLK